MHKKLLIILFFVFWAIPALADLDTAWVRRYNGLGNSDDYASAIIFDNLGNLYVTGYSSGDSGKGYDYATIKYYPNGDTAWLRTYNGCANADDCASAIAVDNSGNVYVTGYSYGGFCSGYAWATVKYDSDGTELWIQRYQGPAWQGEDKAHAIAVDDSGNVYVTGFSDWSWVPDYPMFYYTTIKYYPNGDTAWVRIYGNGRAYAIALDGSGNIYVTGTGFITIKYYPNGYTAWVRESNGCAHAIAVDDSGNVYATGKSEIGLRCTDYLTRRHYPNGDEAWARTYDAGIYYDVAHAISIDSYGNVYVTGYSWAGPEMYPDYATLKYYSNGDVAWVKRYTGFGNAYDVAYAITLDSSSNVYVTGSSWGNGTAADYTTIKYDIEGNELSIRRYNGPGNWTDEARAIAVDDSSNIYVTGWSYGPGTYDDCATIKYYSNGDTAWVRRYNGQRSWRDWASDVIVDDSQNVYVTGVSYGTEAERDYVTIKYYPTGDTAWVRAFNGTGSADDSATAIAVDNLGNVYVTGQSIGDGTGYDYVTIKYCPNGDTAWVRTYNGPFWHDRARAIAVDGSGNVYVTGFSRSGYTYTDYTTIKYGSSGNQLWVRRYNGPANSGDEAYAIAVDALGNVYVTGESRGNTGAERDDYATIKYDSNGNEIWVARYDGIGNWDDVAYAITVDASGNVYVTGESDGPFTRQDYATIKYYPDGDTAWVRRYNGSANSKDQAFAIAVDDLGNVYVTGLSIGSGSGWDYGTIKYDPNGTEVWITRYNGAANSADAAYAIAVDASYNVYVSGESYDAELKKDYATVKYDAEGNEVWVRRYDGPESESDASYGIALDNSGNIYVTGISYGTGTDKDYATIKYIQTESCIWDETGSREGPSEFTLSQNYPNPFNQTTKIEFTLAKSGFVILNIYDILGRKVRTLVSERLSSGYKSVLWDGKNDSGKEVASGIYFYQLRVRDFSETKKLVLVK